ncbi:MAG: hypothetical protein Q8932_16150, partial [Bacteroidota bacterium]|nr:hypothetical protein [Bacteroidota bacterium]
MSRNTSQNPERDKLPVSISLLESTLFEEEDFNHIVDSITGDSIFEEQRLRPLHTRGRQVRLFYARQAKPARWVAFFRPALAPDQPMLKAQNRVASFVCFVGAGRRSFVLTGGLGKFLVQDYLDPNFGMDILVRLIKKDAPSVRSLQDRGVTGTVLGENRFFRGRQRLTDEDQFGKIYKEINAVLNNQTLLKELGFSSLEVKRKTAGCWAKSSFLLSKSIGFEKMLNLVDQLNRILAKPPNFSLNSVILIRNRGERNRQLLENLSTQLKLVLYEDCLNERVPDF